MSPSTVEPPKFVFLEKNALKIPKGPKGPSPYAEKLTEGPSYKQFPTPLKASGKLDNEYKFDEITPHIGREYPEAQLSEIVKDDDKIRDLAITISRRGVVFFKAQDLSIEDQKTLADKLGRLTGKPEKSTIHIHPTAPAGGVLNSNGSGQVDPEVSIISSKLQKQLTPKEFRHKKAGEGFHSDITFEPVPSDYAILKIVETPPTGGDTLWVSGYSLYEKLSPSFRAFLETLTGTYSQENFHKAAERGNFEIYAAERGAPENVGEDLIAHHPIVRTNPVTGWRSVFSIGGHFTSFDGLTDDETKLIKDYLQDLVVASHDIQVRKRWGKNDIAIWDNRSVYHSATNDYFDDNIYERTGVRTVGIGERPYFDPTSKARSEDLHASGLSV
ncbi:Jlp1p [Sugiyamaella lignohabitans]|uniref:Jlp1p n=1 Tax=Sugiyamaella lignohabitans TaxID=796027 RepID=A0A161HH78_9ASCO|nr:Jlp1p [Sugiyamaella lignohabitans]ANB11417.1 Jlp1p [Sugiyamaella lignohabitans]